MTVYFAKVSGDKKIIVTWKLINLIEGAVAVMSLTPIFYFHSLSHANIYLLPSLTTECTYAHFEQSSECPTCRRRLGENDFTELVVADNNINGKDISKSNMQRLFSKKAGSGSLQFADVCQSLIQQIDQSKQSTRFLLKQLLVETHRAGRTSMQASRLHEQLKTENTQLKQINASQRLQYEQTINDLQNKVQAKDGTISEQNHMINNFRKLHGGGTGGGGGRGGNTSSSTGPLHMVPHSSSASLGSSSSRGGPEPPLRGLMAQREANKQAQQNAMNGGTRNRPFMNSMNNLNRNDASFRPFSSGTSTGSGSAASSAPRIRDLTANSGYHFTGIQNNQMNKRRRGGTPGSHGTPQHAMSPNTAFALNNGSHGRNMFQR